MELAQQPQQCAQQPQPPQAVSALAQEPQQWAVSVQRLVSLASGSRLALALTLEVLPVELEPSTLVVAAILHLVLADSEALLAAVQWAEHLEELSAALEQVQAVSQAPSLLSAHRPQRRLPEQEPFARQEQCHLVQERAQAAQAWAEASLQRACLADLYLAVTDSLAPEEQPCPWPLACLPFHRLVQQEAPAWASEHHLWPYLDSASLELAPAVTMAHRRGQWLTPEAQEADLEECMVGSAAPLQVEQAEPLDGLQPRYGLT